jgi:Ca2+-binding EF-hand superfamily protein
VVFESPDIMRRVFEYYDKNQSGKINYKDFIAEVLFESEP